ncbi:MAG: succinyl-diaminopimelate desuccinylase [Acidimicrobiales bacterium]
MSGGRGADLLASAAELVAIPSLSHEERLLADHVEAALRSQGRLEVSRLGDNVVARTQLGREDRLVLAGHLDTVPANGNAMPRVSDGILWGLGAADMKGGLAVMLDLAASLGEPACDFSLVFYVAEEVARADNGLLALASSRPELLEGSAAIVCEPTACAVEAGCQGVLKAEVMMSGARAHVARPWRGRNALHRLGPVLAALDGWAPRRPEIEGCTYQESLQAVGVSGGVAANVVPDRATVELNYRFAPDRDPAGAAAYLGGMVAGWLEDGDSFEVTDSAPAAPPSLHHPALAALVAASGRPVVAKLGWTDVAFFAERAVPAANFGPGDPELAHAACEHVTAAALERARLVLGQVLAGRGAR